MFRTLRVCILDQGINPSKCRSFFVEGEEVREVCGNCKWSKQDVPFSDYTCHCTDSDCYALECEYTDSCVDFEEREDKG